MRHRRVQLSRAGHVYQGGAHAHQDGVWQGGAHQGSTNKETVITGWDCTGGGAQGSGATHIILLLSQQPPGDRTRRAAKQRRGCSATGWGTGRPIRKMRHPAIKQPAPLKSTAASGFALWGGSAIKKQAPHPPPGRARAWQVVGAYGNAR